MLEIPRCLRYKTRCCCCSRTVKYQQTGFNPQSEVYILSVISVSGTLTQLVSQSQIQCFHNQCFWALVIIVSEEMSMRGNRLKHVEVISDNLISIDVDKINELALFFFKNLSRSERQNKNITICY